MEYLKDFYFYLNRRSGYQVSIQIISVHAASVM